MTNLKEWMDEQWRKPGVRCANHGVAYIGDDFKSMQVRAGTVRNYVSRQQKAYESRFAVYNKKLAPIILAEATVEMRNMVIPPKNWKDDETVEKRPHYTWPKQDKQEQAPPVPRKRVPKAKLEQAAAIIAKVPEDELATFLARFGLSLSLAASIASLGDVEMIARQFLRATL